MLGLLRRLKLERPYLFALTRLRALVRDASGTQLRLLLTTTIMAGMCLLAMVIFLLQSSLGTVADHANRMDDRRAEEAIGGAVRQSLTHLANFNEMNSVWDDAVKKVYAPKLSKTWLYSSYGALAQADGDYDGVYIADEKGRVLWGNHDTEETPITTLTPLGYGTIRLFGRYAGRALTPEHPVAGLTRTAYGPAFVSVGLIRPSSDQVAVPSDRRFLILTRHINPTVFGSYAEAYNVNHLIWTDRVGASKRPHVALRDTSGAPLGMLTWDSRQPGEAAARAAAPKIKYTLGLVVVTMLLFATLIIAGIRRLGRSEKRAIAVSMTDLLTGLPNRRALMRHLRTREDTGNVALILLDLDYFKHFNSVYGHEAGDRLLTTIGHHLTALASADSLVARLHADQFGILLWGEDVQMSELRLLASLQLLFKTSFPVGAGWVSLSATIGVAVARRGKLSVREVFRRADAALYYAKEHNRGGVQRYDERLDADIKFQNAVERQIREGLEAGEFEVFYQPLVTASEHRLTGVEALVRWPRRAQGPLSPERFVEVAEKSGLIHELGLFVLRRACEDIKPFDSLRVSVNLSPAQFHDPAFLDKVAAILAETGFPPDRLEMEVTEGHMIDLPEQAQTAIDGLRALGLSIALDDFGMGYSSIGYLRRYHFDKVKLDKSVCENIAIDSKTGALISATVALARALDLSVTAEGVETPEQAKLLSLAGCNTLQGYLFGKPQAIGELRSIVAGQRALARPSSLAG